MGKLIYDFTEKWVIWQLAFPFFGINFFWAYWNSWKAYLIARLAVACVPPVPCLIMYIMTPAPPPPSAAPPPPSLSAAAGYPRRCTPLCWQYEPIAKLDDINVIYWSTNLSHANEIYFHLITINIFPQLEIFLNCVLFSEFERRPSGARSSIALHKGWTQLRPGYTLQLFTTKNGENVNNCKNISFQKAQLTLAKPRSLNRWHTAGDGGPRCYGTISELNK